MSQVDKQLQELQDNVRISKPKKAAPLKNVKATSNKKAKVNTEKVEQTSKEALKNLEEMQL